MGSAVFRSGVIYAVANIAAAAVPFMLLPVLTRALSPAEYGDVVAFYMLVPICMGVAGLSLHGAIGVRWLDTTRSDPAAATATALLMVGVGTVVAATLSALLAPAFGIELSPGLCAGAALVAGATVVQGIRFAVWQSRERPLPAATLQVTSAALNIALSLAGVLVLQWGSDGRIGGAALASMLVAAVCVCSLLRDGSARGATVREAGPLLRFGLPLVPHALAGALLTSADRFAVSGQVGAAALGVYGAAAQLGLVINVLADAVGKAYTPTMYRWLNRDTAAARLRLVAVTYLSIPVWLGVALLLWAVLRAVGGWLLGERYVDAVGLSVWFLLGGALTGVYLNLASLFFFTGKTEWISAATISASLVALAAAAQAVPRYGIVGGATAYVIAQLALVTAAWALSTRIRPLPWGRPLLSVRVLFRRRRNPI